MSQKIPTPTASTQDHLDIEDVIDDLLILKTGWIALVVNTTAVNFDLLSEAEQDATIYAYGAFLNSLTFPVEILIRSKKADISVYFQALAEAEKVQPNPDLKRQIQKYEDFIQATVQQRTVLDKKFYIVITYSPAETGFGMMGKKTSNARVKGAVLEAAKASLYPRRDHVAKQLARLGLSTRQLTSQELVELLYDIYNPAPTGTQRILLDSAAYTAPLVEPAIENPAPVKIEHGFGESENPSYAEASADATPFAKASEVEKALEDKSEGRQIVGEARMPEAGLMPHHAEVAVGQQQAVVDVGLRPVPPGGGSGIADKLEESENPSYAKASADRSEDKQNTGEIRIPEKPVMSEGQAGEGVLTPTVAASSQPAGQSPAQTDALKELQKAVAEASKLSGGINQVPSGGLDLRDGGDSKPGANSTDEGSNSGGFKI